MPVIGATGPTWVEVGLLVVAILSLGVTALNLWRNRREATSAYREKLYERQFRAHEEVYEAAERLNSDALALLTTELPGQAGKPLSIEARQRVRQGTMPALQRVQEAQRQHGIFLPTVVNEALGAYLGTLTAISAQPEFAGDLYEASLVQHVDPSMPLAEAFSQVTGETRAAVGTDALSEAGRALMGKSEREKIADSRRKLANATRNYEERLRGPRRKG